MIGDTADMLARLKSAIPASWLPDSDPVATALLTGPAWVASFAYALFGYVKKQSRLATATDIWVDEYAQDFFGPALPRRPQESDDQYRARIKAKVLQPKDTRQAITDVLTDLVGQAPVIIEPANPGDTGAYNTPSSLAWNTAGYWGSWVIPCQVFVQTVRPLDAGVANIAGFGQVGAASPPCGWGVGSIAWVTQSQAAANVSDADIYQAVSGVKAAGISAFVCISGAPPGR